MHFGSPGRPPGSKSMVLLKENKGFRISAFSSPGDPRVDFGAQNGPKGSHFGCRMAPKWEPKRIQKTCRTNYSKKSPKGGPEGSQGHPWGAPGRSRGIRAVRAAPKPCFHRRMSFFTFSIKSDPGEIEKVWFSLSKTIVFDPKPTSKEKLRKMRSGKETLARGFLH